MLEKYFDFASKEKEIFDAQEKAGAFKAGSGATQGEDSFCVMIPPPNVTGSLHMGHALNNTLQDIMVRRQRMMGKNVLWQVGCDHAGIATQSLVERQLDAEGIKRTDLGRDAFIQRVWDWKEQSGGKIIDQLKALGASLDYSSERFTMDEGLSKAVRHVFIKLYKDGLIYRDKRLVNWDCQLKTAISDLEVVPTEIKGSLYLFRYEIHEKDYPEDSLIIATTRPETMFGDTAIAVHPDDKRYQRFIGKHAVLPVSGRLLPIVADTYADPETGTGAVKITPAHDFNDFEVGKRHGLQVINILHPDGTLNKNCATDYVGIDRLEARKVLVDELKARDILVEIKEHFHAVPHGDRSGSIIEPLLTDQWYVDASKLAPEALKQVKDKTVRFIPENWEKTYFSWLDNIQPWCISRQLWWGHQIPAWYGPDGKIFVAETSEEAQKEADSFYGKKESLTQDPDVLDTWFSSSLWPFSTLGWPIETEKYKTYYPTQLLVTGFDIIFFWVARMMMMGCYLTGKAPFKDIYIHALVRDEKGQKMSKSKGNVIDPLALTEKYGADALRFTLTAMAVQGRDIKLSTKRVEGYRNFGTKLWNASRFAEMNACQYDPDFNIALVQHPVSHWIMGRFYHTLEAVNKMYDLYRFNDIADTLYHFVWGDICDHYIEMVKPLFSSDDIAVQTEIKKVTAYILRQSYILLHPIMPFITEELAEKTTDTLALPILTHTAWPVPPREAFLKQKLISDIDFILQIIQSVRSIRATLQVPAKTFIDIYTYEISSEKRNAIGVHKDILCRLARIGEIYCESEKDLRNKITVQVDQTPIYIPMGEYIDLEQEKKRLSKELEKINKQYTSLKKRLENANFLEKASAEVIEESKENLHKLLKDRDSLKEIVG